MEPRGPGTDRQPSVGGTFVGVPMCKVQVQLHLLMDMDLDHSGAVLRKVPKAAVKLRRICKYLEFIDIWKIMNPSGRDYTFFFSSTQDL